mmetsp:Transcript_10095/g.13908  ORF Transcript_10095/g.13908 Transcript_10095/m.13908 type:complete len:89 (+) Transcript_10095:525-791(+)|eukprot:CAMPEP_0185269662 /NCGR_PEP_ID=MMETSP1359-20130426/40442_1 /TAXON_ID=552665 /ORGANISM="Bigelowiella longifila, Strain CCMP242" /LENGTH=88 /DNA_ID=CAMNT_0027860931 /DNA_START=441 /DNA_END=707 /DNA_ORIENTATION=-
MNLFAEEGMLNGDILWDDDDSVIRGKIDGVLEAKGGGTFSEDNVVEAQDDSNNWLEHADLDSDDSDVEGKGGEAGCCEESYSESTRAL